MPVASRDFTAALLLALTLAVSAYVLAELVGFIPAVLIIAFVAVFIRANRSIVNVPTQNPASIREGEFDAAANPGRADRRRTTLGH